jgi:hypothetical protein
MFEVKDIQDLDVMVVLINGSNSRSSLNWRRRTPQEIPKEVLNTLYQWLKAPLQSGHESTKHK